jgi:hypothetical protein
MRPTPAAQVRPVDDARLRIRRWACGSSGSLVSCSIAVLPLVVACKQHIPSLFIRIRSVLLTNPARPTTPTPLSRGPPSSPFAKPTRLITRQDVLRSASHARASPGLRAQDAAGPLPQRGARRIVAMSTARGRAQPLFGRPLLCAPPPAPSRRHGRAAAPSHRRRWCTRCSSWTPTTPSRRSAPCRASTAGASTGCLCVLLRSGRRRAEVLGCCCRCTCSRYEPALTNSAGSACPDVSPLPLTSPPACLLASQEALDGPVADGLAAVLLFGVIDVSGQGLRKQQGRNSTFSAHCHIGQMDTAAYAVSLTRAVHLLPPQDPARKDGTATAADKPDAPVVRAIALLRARYPSLLVMCDLCLCGYTHHGHCGVMQRAPAPVPAAAAPSGDDKAPQPQQEQWVINNQASIDRLAQIAVAYAAAGAHVIAPSDMMDGRIGGECAGGGRGAAVLASRRAGYKLRRSPVFAKWLRLAAIAHFSVDGPISPTAHSPPFPLQPSRRPWPAPVSGPPCPSCPTPPSSRPASTGRSGACTCLTAKGACRRDCDAPK